MSKARKFRLGPKQRAWLKMLETTRRKQCKDTLFDGVGHCCLNIGRLSLGLPNVNAMERGTLRVSEVLALGLRDSVGRPLKSDDDADIVSCDVLNDSKNYSFRRIATHLRRNAALYFKSSA